MPEPNPQPSIESLSTENDRLKSSNAELVARHAKNKAKIAELEAQNTQLQAKATEAESRVKQLTIDNPVNALCESISVAPQALRNALESDYRFEHRDGVLTILNASDGQPLTVNGKSLPVEADAIKNFLLESKDEAKLKLYRAILVANRASGAASPNPVQHKIAPQAKPVKFGLR